jgi:hypothetical protein
MHILSEHIVLFLRRKQDGVSRKSIFKTLTKNEFHHQTTDSGMVLNVIVTRFGVAGVHI